MFHKVNSYPDVKRLFVFFKLNIIDRRFFNNYHKENVGTRERVIIENFAENKIKKDVLV